MTDAGRQQTRRSESLWPFLAILALTAAAWGGYWMWLVNHIPEGDSIERAQALRGQFGDMFGAVNALFSAMAFAVLIYTMSLQRTELRLQREELAETREELARTASAQEKSEQALQKQVEAMERFAYAAAEQVRAMQSLANATKDSERHERDLAQATRDQAGAMKELARAINDIKYKIK